MLSLHGFLVYCAVYAAAIAVPGPGIVALVSRALRQGARKTLPAIAGMTAGDLVLMSLSAFGLAMVARTLGGLFLAVRLAGAAYLFYLAYRYWTAEVADDAVTEDGGARGFWAYLALTLGNPKPIAFFVALLPTVVDLKTLSPAGYGELCAATLLQLPAITFAYALAAGRVRGMLASRKARIRLNKGAAIVMAGAGIGVAAS